MDVVITLTTESRCGSRPLDFADNPTNLYGVAPADSAPLSYGDTVASVRHGGVCNAERISLVPHCHGTHTECIGHILAETHNVADLPLEPFIAATLIRVRPQRADGTTESYNASAASEDWLITQAALDDALAPLSGDYLQALVIAVETPSDFRAAACAPYFSHQALARIVELGVQHLLVDIPSIDRLYDGGRMDNHRRFWGLMPPTGRTRAQIRLRDRADSGSRTRRGGTLFSDHSIAGSERGCPSQSARPIFVFYRKVTS
ncbi:cyclase family protein [Serratia ureilytica]